MEYQEALKHLENGDVWVRWKDPSHRNIHHGRGRLLEVVGRTQARVIPNQHAGSVVMSLEMLRPWLSRNEAGPFCGKVNRGNTMISEAQGFDWVIVNKHDNTVFAGKGLGFTVDPNRMFTYGEFGSASKARAKIAHGKRFIDIPSNCFEVLTKEKAIKYIAEQKATLSNPAENILATQGKLADAVHDNERPDMTAVLEPIVQPSELPSEVPAGVAVLQPQQTAFQVPQGLPTTTVVGRAINRLSNALENFLAAKSMLLDAKKEVEQAKLDLGSEIAKEMELAKNIITI